jgi:hypothetical protein
VRSEVKKHMIYSKYCWYKDQARWKMTSNVRKIQPHEVHLAELDCIQGQQSFHSGNGFD